MSIQLISTDFDGTILDWGLPLESATPFFEVVGALQKKGVIWAINTGRSIPQLADAIDDTRFPVQPDYIITLERAVHHRPKGGWEDFGDWNKRCTQAHAELNAEAFAIFAKLTTYATKHRGMILQRTENQIEGVIAVNEAQMDETVAFLEELRKDLPHLNWQRNSIYLRFCHIDYHKGSALIELARLLKIDHSQTFAAGDNFNDIPMLDGTAAKWVACPSNALPEVKKIVKKSGGYVANKIAGLGVAEALEACPW